MRIDTHGQTLAFFVERPTTFDCATCNRTLHIRARITHMSSKTHMDNMRRTSTPVTRSYRKQARREHTASHRTFNTRADNDSAYDAWLMQCAIEDGTAADILKEWT